MASRGPRRRQRSYQEIRREIRTGDVLLFQGRSPLSMVIRWGTDSPYSHCGIAAWWEHRLFVFESVGRGVHIVPVSRAVHSYDGRVDWWQVKPEFRPSVDLPTLVREAQTELGKPYAKRSLIRLAWRLLIGQYRNLPDRRKRAPALFCSQYVSQCYQRAGLDLQPETADACTSPADLARSEFLDFMAVLRASR
jgi:hypothetical protein